MLKRIIYSIWRYTFGAILYRFPLFLATLILLDPKKYDPSNIFSYFTGMDLLFTIESDCITGLTYTRNDFYYALLVAWIAVAIVCMIDSVLRMGGGNKTRKITLATICSTWYVILAFVFLLRRFLIWTFGMQITNESLGFLLETNGEESWGFIKSFLLNWQGAKWLIKFILTLLIIGLAEWIWAKWRHKLTHNRIACTITSIVISLLLPIGIISINNYEYVGWLSGQNTLSSVIIAIRDYEKNKLLSENFYENIKRVDEEQQAAYCTDDSLDVIFVIGESFIRHHASLYGYSLPTTPLLQQEERKGNLIAFNNVVSPANGTTVSVTNMLSLNSLANGEKWYDYVFFPQLFHKAGYKVLLFDNQHGIDKSNSGSFYQMYSSITTSRCYDYIADDIWNYDREAVAAVLPFIEKERGKTFYLIHLMGQHVGYEERSPIDDRKFKPNDIKRSEPWITEDMRKLIAYYDNAVLQTDKVLGKLFNSFRNRKAVLIFVSDHGEEVFDYRPMFGRRPMDPKMKKQYAHNMYDVPCVVWMSDKYKSEYPEKAQALYKSKSKPYSHDRIGHLTLSLGRITTPYYRPIDDISNEQFLPTKRLVGKIDYDSLMQTAVIKR